MITYVPFLKAKRNEFNAVGELVPQVRTSICPFFDYPRKPNLDGAQFKNGVEQIAKSLKKHVGLAAEFYFDNFDIDDSVKVGTKHNYRFLLESLVAFEVTPVVSIDRSSAHLSAVVDLKTGGKLRSNAVAFRITPEDFEEYSVVKNDITIKLGPVFAAFDAVDLIFDCRICTNMDAHTTATQVNNFSKQLCDDHNVRRIILTGSSIPASVSEILSVQTEHVMHRRELDIYRAVKPMHLHAPLTFGDYTTVSPAYSDVDLPPEILQNVMTAKLTYTLNGSHFFIRGGALKTSGRSQYFGMAKTLCLKPFFRGATYSSGDQYFVQKGHGIGGNCGPNTVIKPSVNAHISYMVRSGGL